ncbi:MAG: hypothetical protein LZF62_310053 [Nitrospira sp.]|nr:MAG: hypothetical protein LZF62_310053 [Nitrospira sp.]
MEECVEASKFWAATLRVHAIQNFPIHFRFLGERCDPFVCLRHMSLRQQEQLRIILFDRGIQMFVKIVNVADWLRRR